MHTLSLNFKILQYCGLWRPLLWSRGLKSSLFNCLTFVTIFLICTFAMSEFIDLIVSHESIEEFTHGSLILLSMIGACGKALNLVKQREKIIELTNILKNDLCEPRNVEEMKIRWDSERDARSNTVRYLSLTVSTAALILLRSLIMDIPQRNLPFEGWFPYPHDSSQIGFWFAYLHQFIASATGAVINCSFDTLIPGFFMQISAQLKILKFRIETMPRNIQERMKSLSGGRPDDYEKKTLFLESKFLADCIRHHIDIFRLADTSNKIFAPVVSLQFAVSSLVLCVSVYEISKMELFTSEFTAIIMYLACMLVQIFVYCFYGGELSLQSIDICEAVYKMDWLSLHVQTKKSLITMMIRSQRPIIFICSRTIKLSIESFTSLVKLSYSAYSVLSNDR